jgi:large subunit ribosomal protein L18
MGSFNEKRMARIKRKMRIRKKIAGTAACPRISVFRSARHIYAQVIDDTAGCTLIAASSAEKGMAALQAERKGKVAVAAQVGKLVAQRALERGIKRVVFDRNGFIYHGRVKAVADGAREGGLDF